MITPTSITNFNRSKRELEEFWLFCLFVAGKNSDFAAKKVQAVIDQCPKNVGLFDWLRMQSITEVLKIARVGQYERLTKAIKQSLHLPLDIVPMERLLEIHGVGPKTARFFVVHSRRNCQYAVLDTHVLKFLRNNGFPLAPKKTPTPKEYGTWEQIFLNICKLNYPTWSIADVDLRIWKEYSGRG